MRTHYSWRPLREGPPWTLEVWTRNVGIFILFVVGLLFLVGWLTGWRV